MRKTILLYGICLALLATLLKMLEYRFFVRDLSLEIYVGAIAIVFTALGVWAGNRLVSRKKHLPPAGPFQPDGQALKRTGISPREYEVLGLMAVGYSNQEIADRMFVSLATVKTHSANLFGKLEAKRRTQAVQKAKALRLIA